MTADGDNKATAVRLLQHYLRMTARASGVRWDSDNDAEVENIVYSILGAARDEVAEDLQQDAANDFLPYPVAEAVRRCLLHDLATNAEVQQAVAGAVAAHEQRLGRLSYEAQAGTQETRQALVTCPLCARKGAAVYNSERPHYLECTDCHMLWQRVTGGSLVCPKCHSAECIVYTDNAGPDMAGCAVCGHSAYWHEFHQAWHAVAHVAPSACSQCKDTQEE